MDDYTRALSALQAIPCQGDYETWNRIGIEAIAAGLSLDDVDAWSSTGPNYKGRKDVMTNFKGVTPDGGIGPGSLLRRAFGYGWKDPTNKTRHNGQRAPKIVRPPNPIRHGETPTQANMPALGLWERFEQPTEAHGYILAKRGRPDGLRVVPAGDPLNIAGQAVTGWLVVPAWSLAGDLRTLQFIPPPGTGKKLNLPGATFDDGLFVVGDLAESDCFYIVEGIGQAWACWAATGRAAAVCFGAGRMGAVAEILRRAYPGKRLVLVPDRGKEHQAEAIARTISGEWVELPEDKPSNYDANDYAADYGGDELEELLCHTKTPPRRFRLLTAADLAGRPPLRWRVRGVLPEAGIGAIYGPSASGKSFLALDLLAAIAEGRPWFNCRSKAAPVVYVALEGEAGIAQRVQAYQVKHGPLTDGFRFLLSPLDIRDTADRAELVKDIMATEWAGGVLCIDTLNRAAAGMDENDSRDMGQVIDALKALQRELGGLVLAVHHAGKDATKGLRGHSSLLAALDVVLEVTRDGDRREWKLFKAKDGADGTAHPFRLDVVELGQDEDGERITSCVVAPEETPEQAFRKALPPKAGNQKEIWDGIGEMFRQAGPVPPKDAPANIPPGRPAVRLDDAVEHLRVRLMCEPKRQTERTRTALQGLVGRGLLVHLGGWLWCA